MPRSSQTHAGVFQNTRPGWCMRWWPGNCGWPWSWRGSPSTPPWSSGHCPGSRVLPVGYSGHIYHHIMIVFQKENIFKNRSIGFMQNIFWKLKPRRVKVVVATGLDGDSDSLNKNTKSYTRNTSKFKKTHKSSWLSLHYIETSLTFSLVFYESSLSRLW